MIDRNSNVSHAELFITLSVGLCAFQWQVSVWFTKRTGNSTQRFKTQQNGVNILQLYFDNSRREAFSSNEKFSRAKQHFQFRSGDIETLICKYTFDTHDRAIARGEIAW